MRKLLALQITEAAQKIIIESLDNHITIETLARKVGTNVTTLKKIFKDRFGITIAKFIRRKRLEKSKELLLNSDQDLNSIALAVGFCDASYLIVSFQKLYGMTPIKWRKNQILYTQPEIAE